MDHSARNPDFEAVVQASFARQSFMTTLGARLLSVRPGEVRIGYARKDTLLQQHGFIHAGAGTSIVDSACGYAALSLAAPSVEVLTIEFKINFLKPADGSEFEAVGRVIRAGKSIAVCEGELGQRGSDLPIARMQATMMLIAAA